MEVGGMLPSHSQEEISPIKEGDSESIAGSDNCYLERENPADSS